MSLLKMPVKLKSRRYKPEISVPLWYFLVHLIVELSKDDQLAFGLICFHNAVRHIISGYMSLIICSYYKKYFDWIQSQTTNDKKYWWLSSLFCAVLIMLPNLTQWYTTVASIEVLIKYRYFHGGFLDASAYRSQSYIEEKDQILHDCWYWW